MKLVNYALQNQIEYLGEDKSNSYFKNYIQSILEDTSKPYYQRADYVGLSLNELKLKIDSLSNDIQELQVLKKKLSSSLEIAKELVAEVFVNNGIDRIDGNIISSLTISTPTSKVKQIITIKDENAVMGLGYVKFSVDEEAIEKAIQTKEGLKELKQFIQITPMTVTTPAKVKVNTKRTSTNSIVEIDEILTLPKVA
ncbi:MAG: siphovirus Gp157 family protein [Arcobacteraceae bacterium]